VSLARVAILSDAGDSVPLGFGLGLSVEFISDLAFTSNSVGKDKGKKRTQQQHNIQQIKEQYTGVKRFTLSSA
jgi:hypothetical protein